EGVRARPISLALIALGNLYRGSARLDDAKAMYEQALAIQQKANAGQSADAAETLYELAGIAQRQGRGDDAERLYRQALAARRKSPGGPANLSKIAGHLAQLLDSQRRHAEAVKRISENPATASSQPAHDRRRGPL